MTETRTAIRMSAGTKIYLYVSLTIIAAVVVIPLLTTALGGFKTLGDLRVNPFGLPVEWQWSNYTDILFGERYWRQMMNSLIIATLTVFLTVSVAAMAAFTFAHVKFFGATFLLNYFLIGLMFPAATAILPLFIRIRDLGLLNSYWGVVLPQVAFGLGMSILLFRNYFRNLPEELFQAAFVDGCGYMRFFWHVTLPLSRPIIATVAIVSFVASWNSYILPLIMLNSESIYPWPLGIMVYRGEFGTEWQLVLAFITLTILPTIIVFFLAQKHIIAGLTAGAVKS
ncbi:carbohydrate ABC transporter membrane protein 2 (CUT1 family) [Neorhizobium sp. R1-B]|uniref:carbohydrate ABC transporter permease n=1 Tax=Neorhizobium TaxID=1525371 RepID=UPI000CF928F2|nr:MULTISPECIES: carbohydrate ABC transporter permease [Neorhizobium]TCV73638.1 carbohydrate ABC transporter membrane protein 2 (CUT1 family) [Neorhizobium sp. S3-V5DH]TDX85626.1 carbohydrate ABC transporter membrane protein 2 (CUT1 family) [Neorhizobium sp. R1-B]